MHDLTLRLLCLLGLWMTTAQAQEPKVEPPTWPELSSKQTEAAKLALRRLGDEGEEVADLVLAMGEDSPLEVGHQGGRPWMDLVAVDLVPAEARSVEFILETTPGPGTKGGWADDLSLVISRR